MKPRNLRRQYFLWLMVSVLSACGANIQDDNYTSNSKAAENYLRLGIEYMRLGKNDIALGKLEKALKLDNNYADAHNTIAIFYDKLLGETYKARQHYQKAVELKPKDSDIHNNYGQFLCKHDQRKQAHKHFLQALKNRLYKYPEIPYTNAGLCALRYQDFTQAETYFRKALQKNSKFPRALYKMAELSYKHKLYEQARDYLQRYLEVAKHTPKTLWLRIRLERKFNNRDAEASYAMLLLRNFPDSEETQLLNQSKNPQYPQGISH